MITRRRFLGVSMGLIAAPLAAEAQPVGQAHRIGFLSIGRPELNARARGTLLEGLGQLGWIEGRNIRLEHRAAERPDELAGMATELVRLKPAVIVSRGPTATMALKETRTDIPVVFAVVANPLALGLAQSVRRPGGNFTGLATTVPEGYIGKLLELMRELVPRVSRVGLLTNPENPMHATLYKEDAKRVKQLDKDYAVEFRLVQAKTSGELEGAFAAAKRQKCDAVIAVGDAVTTSQNAERTADLAAKYRLPVVYFFRELVEAGGLMSYGVHTPDLLRRSAGYVDKILKGVKPGDLPIEQPTKYELLINIKAAKALGLTVPPSLLIRADQVIE